MQISSAEIQTMVLFKKPANSKLSMNQKTMKQTSIFEYLNFWVDITSDRIVSKGVKIYVSKSNKISKEKSLWKRVQTCWGFNAHRWNLYTHSEPELTYPLTRVSRTSEMKMLRTKAGYILMWKRGIVFTRNLWHTGLV